MLTQISRVLLRKGAMPIRAFSAQPKITEITISTESHDISPKATTAITEPTGHQLPEQKVSFGFKEVHSNEKQKHVNSVFTSVASSYDVMNDLMSGGVHRLWKQYLIQEVGVLKPERVYSEGRVVGLRPVRVLDMSAGTGDIAFRLVSLQQQNAENPNDLASQLHVTLFDPNEAILNEAKKKASSLNIQPAVLDYKVGTAEDLSGIPDNSLDLYIISFGLRNTTSVEKALREAHRVLRRGGRFLCLEFSKVSDPILREFYRMYSFNVIPLMGQLVAGDRDSYQYLVESIEKFLDQEQLLEKMRDAGFSHVSYENLTLGVVALHSGYKL
jgi:2-methoxy-6-polyprenyl-1,4-benzoquinol methylase